MAFVLFGIEAEAVEQGEPHVAERRVFGQHEMMAELEVRGTAGEERGAVVEVMDRADVAAVGKTSVIEEAAAVRFLRSFEFVDESGKQFALRRITFLRGFHAWTGGVVAHIVRRDFQIEALQQRADRLPISEHARAVRLQGRNDEVVHAL